MLARSKTSAPGNSDATLPTLIGMARDVASRLECGQAQTPLNVALDAIQNGSTIAPCVISCLGLGSGNVPGLLELEEQPDPAGGQAMVGAMQRIRLDFSGAGVQLEYLGDRARLWHDPQLFQQLCSASPLLLLFGSGRHELSGEERALLPELVSAFAVVWPVIAATNNAGCHESSTEVC